MRRSATVRSKPPPGPARLESPLDAMLRAKALAPALSAKGGKPATRSRRTLFSYVAVRLAIRQYVPFYSSLRWRVRLAPSHRRQGHEALKDRGGALSRVETRFVRGRDRAEPLLESYDVGSTTMSAVMVGAWVLQTSL